MRSLLLRFSLLIQVLVMPSVMSELTIHLVPLSYCEMSEVVSSAQTVDKMGQIMDSVLEAMRENDKRTFNVGNLYAFSKWYESLDLSEQEEVKHLVKDQRLDFTNGSWVTGDEVVTNAYQLLSLYQMGHEYLEETFDYVPRIAFQAQNFGRSFVLPMLLDQLGYHGLFYDRVNASMMKDTDFRRQFLWTIPSSEDPHSDSDFETEIYTEVMDSTHTYYAPSKERAGRMITFDFEQEMAEEDGDALINCRDAYDDPRECASLLDAIINKMKMNVVSQKHLLLPFGTDYGFTKAKQFYESIEWVMGAFNKGKFKKTLQYSTFTKYLKQINSSKSPSTRFPTFRGDFQPDNMGEANVHINGFYSLKPAVKRTIREIDAVFTQVETMLNLNILQYESEKLEEYLRYLKLHKREFIINYHNCRIGGLCYGASVAEVVHELAEINKSIRRIYDETIQELIKLKQRQRESHGLIGAVGSSFTDLDMEGVDILEVKAHTIFNPQVTIKQDAMEVPILNSYEDIVVVDMEGNVIPSFLFEHKKKANNKLWFRVTISPLALTTYFVYCIRQDTPGILSEDNLASKIKQHNLSYYQKEIVIENSHLKVTADKTTGRLKSLQNKGSKKVEPLTIPFEQSFFAFRTDKESSSIYNLDISNRFNLPNPEMKLIAVESWDCKVFHKLILYFRREDHMYSQEITLYEWENFFRLKIYHRAEELEDFGVEFNTKNDGLMYLDHTFHASMLNTDSRLRHDIEHPQKHFRSLPNGFYMLYHPKGMNEYLGVINGHPMTFNGYNDKKKGNFEVLLQRSPADLEDTDETFSEFHIFLCELDKLENTRAAARNSLSNPLVPITKTSDLQDQNIVRKKYGIEDSFLPHGGFPKGIEILGFHHTPAKDKLMLILRNLHGRRQVIKKDTFHQVNQDLNYVGRYTLTGDELIETSIFKKPYFKVDPYRTLFMQLNLKFLVNHRSEEHYLEEELKHHRDPENFVLEPYDIAGYKFALNGTEEVYRGAKELRHHQDFTQSDDQQSNFDGVIDNADQYKKATSGHSGHPSGGNPTHGVDGEGSHQENQNNLNDPSYSLTGRYNDDNGFISANKQPQGDDDRQDDTDIIPSVIIVALAASLMGYYIWNQKKEGQRYSHVKSR